MGEQKNTIENFWILPPTEFGHMILRMLCKGDVPKDIKLVHHGIQHPTLALEKIHHGTHQYL